jgi:predicted RNase H-like HicB family nuclease
MILPGIITKEDGFWIAECAALDAMTQGRTKKEALQMLLDWVQTALDDPSFSIDLREVSKGALHLTFEDPRRIVGLIIERARESAGMTYEEVAFKVGLKNRSGIKSMTLGKHDHRFSKLLSTLNAVGYDLKIEVVPRTGT